MEFFMPEPNGEEHDCAPAGNFDPPGKTPKCSLSVFTDVRQRFEELGFQPMTHANDISMFNTLFFGMQNVLVIKTEGGQIRCHYFVSGPS